MTSVVSVVTVISGASLSVLLAAALLTLLAALTAVLSAAAFTPTPAVAAVKIIVAARILDRNPLFISIASLIFVVSGQSTWSDVIDPVHICVFVELAERFKIFRADIECSTELSNGERLWVLGFVVQHNSLHAEFV